MNAGHSTLETEGDTSTAAGPGRETNAPLTFDEFPAATPEEWRVAAESTLKGASFEKKLITQTPEGIALQPIYFASPDAPAAATPSVKYGGLLAQEIPFSEPAAFNRALLASLMAGQNCAPIPRHLEIRNLADLRAALDGVDLSAAPLIHWAGASALPMLALVAAIAEERGVQIASWTESVLGDPLSEWVENGLPDLTLSAALDEMATTLRWGYEKAPRFRLIGVRAHLWGDAGATATDELAFALATATEYLRELSQRGLAVEDITPRLCVSLSLDSRIFMQIAKLRAAREAWARIVEAFGGDPKVARLFIHGRSCTFTKSTLDPHTNLLRTTAEAFAGIVGGVDSLELSAFDAAIRQPDEFSSRLARNIPIILEEECGLADVADAARGSWYVEQLTQEVAERAWQRFQEIEAAGGMAAALRKGEPQQITEAAATARERAVAAGRELFVGVNLSANPQETLHSRRPSPSFHSSASRESLARTETRISLIPSAIEAFLSGWTISQVRAALTGSSAGEPDVERVQARSATRGFETLRARALQIADGSPPTAWLATFGPPRQHRARADFSQAFLACGGFDVRSGKGASEIDTVVDAAVVANAPVVVICSTDETYPEIVPAFAKALKQRHPSVHLLLAGAPGEHESAYREAGVDDFIHLRVNRLEFLDRLLSTLSTKKT